MIYCRYKNCFFNKREAQNQAERALLRLLKDEVNAVPTIAEPQAQPDVQEVQPVEGLAGALNQIRQRGDQDRNGAEAAAADMEENCIQMYLNAELESVSCLKYWEKQDKEFGYQKFKGALCRLAIQVISSKNKRPSRMAGLVGLVS